MKIKKRVREKENFTLFVINNLTISHDIEEGLFFDLSKVLYGLGTKQNSAKIRNSLLIHRKFRFRKGRLIN